MTSYQENVLCLMENREAAENAVAELLRDGFPKDSISLVAASIEAREPLQKALNRRDTAERDAAIGAGTGGTVGAIAGISLATSLGAGAALVAAGPIVGAGVIAGAFIGAMTGWGVKKDRAHEWEEKIKGGHVLVVAHGDALLAARAYRVLQELKPIELHQESLRNDASDADE